MRPFRLLLVQRLVAVWLLVGAGAVCVPAAAADAPAGPLDDLREALEDGAAVEAALEAARQAPTPKAAADAFVRVYTEAAGDPAAARDVARLLLDRPNRFGAPPLQATALLKAAAGPTLSLDRALAVLAAPCDARGDAPGGRPVVLGAASAPPAPADADQRTRAP